jgi:phosphoribosylformimino-5-aminoimidazole carboxamide ribotide isomerase
MILIPALDFLDQKVVRLKRGQFQDVDYFTDSLSVLLERIPAAFTRLHAVNLSGALKGANEDSWKFFSSLPSKRFSIQLGGGIEKLEDLPILREIGIQKIVLGSIWEKDFGLAEALTKAWGAENVVAALDVRSENETKLQVRGWTETSKLDLFELLPRASEIGIREYLVTSIDRDGMRSGPNLKLYERIQASGDYNVIASGGVRDWTDLKNLREAGLHACVVGRAWLEDAQFFENTPEDWRHA